MKGGWRYGAGRPSNRRKTWQVARCDVHRLARAGHIPAHATSLRFAYTFRFADGPRDIDTQVSIVRQPCTLGGTRPMFVCPHCRRTCGVIYCNGWPACIRCARLSYQSQSEDPLGRSWLRTQKIEARMGCSEHGPRRRPKGMRQATYARLLSAWWDEDMFRDYTLTAYMDTMVARYPFLAREFGTR